MADPHPEDGMHEEKTRLDLDPHLRRVVLAIGYLLIAGGILLAIHAVYPILRTVLGILAPFLVAAIVAYVFNPIVTFVQRRLRLSRVAGVFLVSLGIVLGAAIFVAIIVPILSTQVRASYDGISDTVRDKLIPYTYRQLGVELAPEEASFTELQRRVDAWIEVTGALELNGDQRRHLEQLAGQIDAWIETNRNSEGGMDSDFASLEQILDEWIEQAGLYQSEEAATPDYRPLREQLAEWRGDRARFEREGEYDLRLREVQQRIERHLAERGIILGDLLTKAAESPQVRSAASTAASGSVGLVGSVVGGVANAIAGLFSSVMFIVFVLLVSFYLLVDFASFRGIFEIMIPVAHQERTFDVLGKVDTAVGGFIRGQILTAVIVGCLTTIGLFLLGLKQYAVLIGVVAGIGNLIPYLGSIMGATPALLYVLFSDAYDSTQERAIFIGLTLVVFGIIQFIEGFILQPKIIGKSAQLHPVVVIVALAFGAQFGLVGMILALPMAAIVRVLLKEFYWDTREQDWRDRTGKEKLDEVKPRKKKTRSSPKATE